MRISALFLCFFACICFATGQENSHLEQDISPFTKPTISGLLKNYQEDLYKDLYINYVVISPDFQGMKQQTAKINEDGSFNIDLKGGLPFQKVKFTLGDLYQGVLIANSSLEILIDLNEVSKRTDNFAAKGVVFQGEDGGITQFYNKYYEYKTDKKNDIRKRKFSSLRNRTSQGPYKVKQLASFYAELEKIETTFCKKNGSSYRWILQNERLSENYSDITSIFIGKPIPADLWNEVLDHKPALISELSNRYYGILATKLWSHEEKEIRSFSRMIYKADTEDEEAKKAIDLFLIEQDKRNAGVSYDNEVYAKGLENYVEKYQEQVGEAKLDLFLEKLSALPEGKRGLVAIKGQPLSPDDRMKYIEKASNIISYDWHTNMMKDEVAKEEERLSRISKLVSNSPIDGTEPQLGKLNKFLPTGAGLWMSNASNIDDLLRQVKNYYKEKAVAIYIWNTACVTCKEELKQSGLTYDKLEEHPMEVLTIALNQKTSPGEWEESLLSSYIKGQHIYLDKKLTSEIIEYFQLPSIPCYLYFDGSGKFIPYKVNSISDFDIEDILSSG